MSLLHASCVKLGSHGVLIRGGPGSGKSDLALRLIDAGGQLVADDYTQIEVERGCIFGLAPAEISGRIEARGVGLLTLPFEDRSEVSLIVDLAPRSEIERLPDEAWETFEGIRVRTIKLCGFDASAVAKIRLLLASAEDPEDVSGG